MNKKPKKTNAFPLLLLPFFLVSLGLYVLYAQSAGELRVERAELLAKIADFDKQREQEAKDLKEFLEQKQRIIAQKVSEQKVTAEEIARRQSEIAKTRDESANIEQAREKIRQRDRSVLLLVSRFASDYLQEIREGGIPFASKIRASVLETLISDIESDRVVSTEAITRFFSFLDSEVGMGYDAEVRRDILTLPDGRSQSGTVLRVGRVFFAFQTEDSTYVFFKEPNGQYALNTEKVSLEERRLISEAIEMIEGRRPPDFLPLPVSPTSLETKGGLQ